MKQTNSLKIPINIEKKEGKSIDEFKNTFDVLEKEKENNNSESPVKQIEEEPQEVIPPLKPNSTEGIISYENPTVKIEDTDSSDNKEKKMEIETNEEFNEFPQLENMLMEIHKENKDIQQEKEKIDKPDTIKLEITHNNNEKINIENKMQQDNENEVQHNNENKVQVDNENKIQKDNEIKIHQDSENISNKDIQQPIKKDETKSITNEINIASSEEKNESKIIKNDISKEEKENDNQKMIEEESNPQSQNENQRNNKEQISIEKNQNVNNNNNTLEKGDKNNEESNNEIKDIDNENQNPNISEENKSTINEENQLTKEKIIQNNKQSKLLDAIESVVDSRLSRIQKEEIRKIFGLQTDEEVDQFFNKANSDNQLTDINIQPESNNLSQLSGLDSNNENPLALKSSYPDEILEELKKKFPNRSLLGLPNKEYFMSKYANNSNSNTILYNPYDFKYQDVKRDGNDGYRCIALQLLGSEEFHNDIRMDVYNFLHNNRDNFPHLAFQINGKVVPAQEYIENIKNPGFEMGDLELYVINLIYDAILFIFQLKGEDELSLLQIKGNIKNMDCILLTICIVDEDHFTVVYEKYRSYEEIKTVKNNIGISLDTILSKTLIKDINLAYELNYASHNRKYRYKDMINYMISKKFNRDAIYPEFIFDIKTKQLRTYKKKEFKKSLKNYYIDEKTKRLKVKFNFVKIIELLNKEYFIPFQIEKIQIIKLLHDASVHKEQSLSDLVKKSEYWWYGIYQDVKNAVNFCPLCKKRPKTKIIKPRPFFFGKNLGNGSSNEVPPNNQQQSNNDNK